MIAYFRDLLQTLKSIDQHLSDRPRETPKRPLDCHYWDGKKWVKDPPWVDPYHE